MGIYKVLEEIKEFIVKGESDKALSKINEFISVKDSDKIISFNLHNDESTIVLSNVTSSHIVSYLNSVLDNLDERDEGFKRFAIKRLSLHNKIDEAIDNLKELLGDDFDIKAMEVSDEVLEKIISNITGGEKDEEV